MAWPFLDGSAASGELSGILVSKMEKNFQIFTYLHTYCVLIRMAAPTSKHDFDVFDNSDVESDTFSLEERTWKRLEEQKHKVIRLSIMPRFFWLGQSGSYQVLTRCGRT